MPELKEKSYVGIKKQVQKISMFCLRYSFTSFKQRRLEEALSKMEDNYNMKIEQKRM